MMRASLFTSNSNQCRRFTSVVLTVILFVAVGLILNNYLFDDSTLELKEKYNQMYSSDTNYDTIIVGSSHAKQGFVEEIIDDITGCNAINLGSNLQCLDGSLAIIKEANKYNDIKLVYLELFYWIAMRGNYEDRTELTGTYIVSDPMKPSMDKWAYLVNASSPDYWVNSFIPARRYWYKLFDLSRFLEDEQQNDLIINEGLNNQPQENKWKEWSSEAISNIRLDSNISDWKNSLMAIVEYCDDNGIKLCLVVTPEPSISILGKRNYDEYYEFIRTFSDDHHVEYLDFNLARKEFFDTNDYSMFKDGDHLNGEGAQKFSRLLGDYRNGDIPYDQLFYKNYREKMMDQEGQVFGLAGPIYVNDSCYGARLITNIELPGVFTIKINYDDGNVVEIPQVSSEDTFYYDKNRHGHILVLEGSEKTQWGFEF